MYTCVYVVVKKKCTVHDILYLLSTRLPICCSICLYFRDRTRHLGQCPLRHYYFCDTQEISPRSPDTFLLIEFLSSAFWPDCFEHWQSCPDTRAQASLSCSWQICSMHQYSACWATAIFSNPVAASLLRLLPQRHPLSSWCHTGHVSARMEGVLRVMTAAGGNLNTKSYMKIKKQRWSNSNHQLNSMMLRSSSFITNASTQHHNK